MPSTDRNRMTRTSSVFITYDDNAKKYKVHAPGNVPGVDMAHAHGPNRDVYWVFHNQTNTDVTVKMKFDPALFTPAFKSTDPVALPEGGMMTISQSVRRANSATVKGETKGTFWGWELTFGLYVGEELVDPGIRIDDGKSRTIAVAVVSFAVGVGVGLLL